MVVTSNLFNFICGTYIIIYRPIITGCNYSTYLPIISSNYFERYFSYCFRQP